MISEVRPGRTAETHTKEAPVFDQDDDLEAALVSAVRERTPGQSIRQALREHLLLKQTQFAAHAADPRFAGFTRLVQETPALRDYAHRMWTRHEAALTRAIAEAVGATRGRRQLRRPGPFRP